VTPGRDWNRVLLSAEQRLDLSLGTARGRRLDGRIRSVKILLAALALAAGAPSPSEAATYPSVASSVVTIKGDWFGHTTPAAQYRAYQNPGDTFRIICPEPCPVDPNVVAAFHFGFSQAAQQTVQFFGLDILPALKPIDLHIANDTWCGSYQPGFTGDSGQYPSSSGLSTAYGCFWYADRPDFFEPFTADNVAQVSYHLLTVHEYTHPIFFLRHFYSYEDFAKTASFFVSGVGGAPTIRDACDAHLFPLNQGRLPWSLCHLNGFSYAQLPAAMPQLDALYHSGAGVIDQGTPPKTSVFQFRKILNGILHSDTRDAFLSILLPAPQVEDDTTLPGSGGVARFLGGKAVLEIAPHAVAGNPAVHVGSLYALPAGAVIAHLDFNEIYAFTPPLAFAKPATLRIEYDPSLLPDGVREETLKLYRLVGNAWQAVPGARVDTLHSEIVAPVGALGTFGSFGATSSPAGESLFLSGVGSLRGAGGTNVKTAFQLHNGGIAGSSGRLILHAPGNPADGATLAYQLRSGETQTHNDLLAALGASGLGSLEIAPDSGPAPISSTRIFNDLGAAGSYGFSEEAVKDSGALSAGDTTVLLAPPDFAAQRLNLGVRPLGGDATLTVTMRTASGSLLGTINRTFPGTVLDQESVAQFAPGIPFSGNESFTVTVTAGRAFVYGVAVDSRTNDGSFEPGRNLAFAPATDGSIVYVPAVGSLEGAQHAHIRTPFQLHNTSSSPVSGKLLFHPAARAASAGDPFLAYALAPFQTISYPDLLPAMGQSGLGTLDVVSTSGPPPLALARVINDLGAGGAPGLTEETATDAEVLGAGDHADLLIPPDLSKQRINIGVRTFAAAVLAVTLSDHSGFSQPLLTKSIAAGQFQQSSLADFLGGAAIPPGGSVRIEVIGGQALIYGSVVDNVTNDSSYQIARRQPYR